MIRIKKNDKFVSPLYVRTSTAAAMTMGYIPGKFFRDAKLYCVNLLLTYNKGCAARCAYCGLSRSREKNEPWSEHSFIRVGWPTVALDELIAAMNAPRCSHVERVCVSMITNRKALEDAISVVKELREVFERISVLITPTIIDHDWLQELKNVGADMVGIAIDAATRDLFEKYRGRGVQGPHQWNKYWKTVEEAVEVFGERNVGIHLIVGLGETEMEMVETIQRAYKRGAQTHLFSFFPEENSLIQDHPQPPIGQYRRMQLARYIIDQGLTSVERMRFDKSGRLRYYGVDEEVLDGIIDSGHPFVTSGCPGETMGNACNRPFANCTPLQAYSGEMRNYPFHPDAEDLSRIKEQLLDFSPATTPTPLFDPGT